jgi:hypothetical protein
MSGKGGNTTTQTTTLDPRSERFLQSMRGTARSAAATALGDPNKSFFTGQFTQTPEEMASPFFNPFQERVVGGVQSAFDRLRDQSATNVSQAATAGGAFGGSRHGVAQGIRAGELDRAEGQQIGGLLQSGFQNALGMGLNFAERQRQLREQQLQEPLFRQQNALNFMNLGMGPVGQTQTLTEPGGSPLGGALGGAQIGSAFGPWGALAGGGLGLLGGLL